METVSTPSKDSPNERALKRVRFTSEVEEHQASYTPYKKAKKELNYARMLRNFSYLLREERYSALELYLNSHTSEEIKEFYKKFGKIIFGNTLLYSNTTGPLSFLLGAIPIETILNILNKNQSDLVRKLITIQNILQKNKKTIPAGIAEFSEKVKILLSLNNKEITNTIREMIEQDGINKNIKDSFNVINLTLNISHK